MLQCRIAALKKYEYFTDCSLAACVIFIYEDDSNSIYNPVSAFEYPLSLIT